MIFDVDTTSYVRVYTLDEKDSWQPEGGGHFIIQVEEELISIYDGTRIIVSSPILHTPEGYRVTDNMILVWIDPILHREIAVSFPSQAACSAALHDLEAIRSSRTSGYFENSLQQKSEADMHSSVGPVSYHRFDPEDSRNEEEGSNFPTMVDITNLDHVCEFLIRLAKNDPESLVTFLTMNSDIIRQLLHVFPSLLENSTENEPDVKKNMADRIRIVVSTMRTILMTACTRPNHRVFTILIGSYENVFLLIWVLQHDAELNPRGVDHTEHIRTKIESLTVLDELPFTEEQLSRIKYVYILSYLRESVAPRVIEDDSVVGGPLPQQLNKLKHEIYRQIFTDGDCMHRLVGKLTVRTLGVLYELMSNMKTCFFPIEVREKYSQELIKCGLLYSAAPLVYEGAVHIRGIITDLIYQVTSIVPDTVRKFLISQEEAGVHYALLHMMINRLIHEDVERISIAWREILSHLLITPSTTSGISDFIPFRSVFFQSENQLFEKVIIHIYDSLSNTGMELSNYSPEEKDNAVATTTLKGATEWGKSGPSRTVLGFLTFVIQRHWLLVHTMLTGQRKVLRTIAQVIANPKMPLPTRLSCCELIRNAVAMCSHRETKLLVSQHVLEISVQPLLVPQQRINPMFASAVVSIFTALYIKEAYEALQDILQQIGPSVFGVNGLRQIFHAISTTGIGSRTTSHDRSDDYIFDYDSSDLDLDNAQPHYHTRESDLSLSATMSPQNEESRWHEKGSLSDNISTPTGTCIATPEALQRVANMCRKRVCDEDDDSPLDRLLRRRSK